MGMSKKDFIAIADAVREHEYNIEKYMVSPSVTHFEKDQLNALADAFKRINPQFNRERWLSYIAGECGPSGGAVKK